MNTKRKLTFLTVFAVVLINAPGIYGENRPKSPSLHGEASATPSDASLARLQSEFIETIKRSRAAQEKLLTIYEQNAEKLRLEHERRKPLFNQELISRRELEEVEFKLERALLDVEGVKRSIGETDFALAEALAREELLRLPSPTAGSYSESKTLVRFLGSPLWSLANAPVIENFYTKTFGRALPISAFGQTATHDRLKFNHGGAMDVALHPDSNEGRALLAFLRQTGVPFLAFRGAVPGSATGAHIHIGKPSMRSH